MDLLKDYLHHHSLNQLVLDSEASLPSAEQLDELLLQPWTTAQFDFDSTPSASMPMLSSTINPQQAHDGCLDEDVLVARPSSKLPLTLDRHPKHQNGRTSPTMHGSSDRLIMSQDNVEPAATEQEEKRRRSSLASARFRQKKKEKEQQLEHHVQALKEQCKKHQQRIQDLEQENKLLRSLLLEKRSA